MPESAAEEGGYLASFADFWLSAGEEECGHAWRHPPVLGEDSSFEHSKKSTHDAEEEDVVGWSARMKEKDVKDSSEKDEKDDDEISKCRNRKDSDGPQLEGDEESPLGGEVKKRRKCMRKKDDANDAERYLKEE